MPGWAVPLVSAGIGGVQSYLESRRRKQGYDLPPEVLQLIADLKKRYRGAAPSWLTAPYLRRGKRIGEDFGDYPAMIGTESAMKERFVTGPMSEAIKGHKESLLRAIADLTRGTGTRWQEGQWDIDAPLEDIGAMIWELMHGDKGGSLSGGGGQYGSGRGRTMTRPGREW